MIVTIMMYDNDHNNIGCNYYDEYYMPYPFTSLGGAVIQENDQGTLIQQHNEGTAEEARARVRSFFDDLRETVNRQEEAGLAVVDNYVREKLFSLRQQQEDMAVLIAQVNSVCLECEKSLQRTDAEVSGILTLS